MESCILNVASNIVIFKLSNYDFGYPITLKVDLVKLFLDKTSFSGEPVKSLVEYLFQIF